MKSDQASNSSSKNVWLRMTMGWLLIAASLAHLVAMNRLPANYFMAVHATGLLICLFGARQVLRRTNGWFRIVVSGLICGLVHGTWGFLHVLFPPPNAPPNYFRGMEGAIIEFVLFTLFTSVPAMFASAFAEVLALVVRILNTPKQSERIKTHAINTSMGNKRL
jgi:hypothetical protein